MGEIPSLHNIELTLINGEKVTLSKYAGRKLLIVNVASKCGFTSQYQGLQELYKANTEKLEGVTFTIADKVTIVSSPHPLYQWLMSKELNGVRDVDITWNFYKFLINEEGQLEHVYSSDVHPFDDEIYSWVVSAESRLSAS